MLCPRQLGSLSGQTSTQHGPHHLFLGQPLAPVRLQSRQARAAVLRCAAIAVAAPPPQSSYKKAKIHQDYAAVDSDSAVLKRPLKDVLAAEDVKNVFGYPRDLRDWYASCLSSIDLCFAAGYQILLTKKHGSVRKPCTRCRASSTPSAGTLSARFLALGALEWCVRRCTRPPIAGMHLCAKPHRQQRPAHIMVTEHMLTPAQTPGTSGQSGPKELHGCRYACKTIPKIPKRGQSTPRYLLKLQTEVDAMQQLGPSFDAVSLKVGLHHARLLSQGALPAGLLHCLPAQGLH